MYESKPQNPALLKKVEIMIFSKLVTARTLSPNIEELNISSIKGLCAVIAFSKNINFGSSLNDPEIEGLVKGYISSIEPHIKKYRAPLEIQ